MTMPPMTSVFAIALGLLLGAEAFNPISSHIEPVRNSLISLSSDLPSIMLCRPTTSLHMCICINCVRVTNCSAYYFVEEQHAQPHINKNPTWEPRNGSPTIQVHIRPNADKKAEMELEKMWNEHESQTRQAEAAAAGEGRVDTPLVGDKQYDLSGITSYEYDVVECEDFVEERGAWVKNMPEEIRLANPNFVPT
ncbi:hypothetical protein ACHAWU_003972 [Discostella pseudostelligera]|uniref:Uncharacterized protein n=1 Tax=Discostella pseudostelligera TaxID=259834 RepID=A0ABD3MUM4_9STRA